MSTSSRHSRSTPAAGWARDGLIEATKASNPLYRTTLRFFLWFGRLSPRTRWGIIIGGILGYNYLYGAIETNPGLKVIAYPLMALWVAFILLSWTVEPLSDFVLGLDDEGRRLVTPERRLAARWVTGTLVTAVALGGLGLRPRASNESACPPWPPASYVGPERQLAIASNSRASSTSHVVIPATSCVARSTRTVR